MRRASPICSPTVKTGLSDVIGSWKIIAICPPRIRRSSAVRRPDELAGPRTGSEPPTVAGLSTSRKIESAVRDLPLPDSPTTQTSRPARRRSSPRRRPQSGRPPPGKVTRRVANGKNEARPSQPYLSR